MASINYKDPSLLATSSANGMMSITDKQQISNILTSLDGYGAMSLADRAQISSIIKALDGYGLGPAIDAGPFNVGYQDAFPETLYSFPIGIVSGQKRTVGVCIEGWQQANPYVGYQAEYIVDLVAVTDGYVTWLDGSAPIPSRTSGTLDWTTSLTITDVLLNCNVAAASAGSLDSNWQVRIWPREIVSTSSTPGIQPGTWATVDTTPPTISAFNVPSYYNSTTIPATFITATDNVSATGYAITSDTATVPAIETFGARNSVSITVTTGSHALRAYACDAAGNISSAYLTNVTIDTTAPVMTAFEAPATSDVTTFNLVTDPAATDNISVTGYAITSDTTAVPSLGSFVYPAPHQFTTTNGSHTLRAYARDAAGNISTAMTSSIVVTVTSDTEAPVMTAFEIPSLSQTLTFTFTTPPAATDNVGVTGYAVTENTSTVPSAGSFGTAPTGHTVSANGVYTLRAYAIDAMGNISTPIVRTVVVVASSASAFVNLGLVSGTTYHMRWTYDFSTSGQLADWQALNSNITHAPTADTSGAMACAGTGGTVSGARWTLPVAVTRVDARCSIGTQGTAQIYTNTDPAFNGGSFSPNPGYGGLDTAFGTNDFYLMNNGASNQGAGHTAFLANTFYDRFFLIEPTLLTTGRTGITPNYTLSGTFTPVETGRVVIGAYIDSISVSNVIIEGTITL